MLKKLPFIVLFAIPMAAGGCFISGDDDDNGKGNDVDCDETHTTCVADCDDEDDACIASCDSDRSDCD